MGEEKLSDNVKMHLKVGRLCSAVEENNRNQERMFKTIYGDGNGEKGHVIRIDRLEQRAKRTDRFSWAAFGAAIVAAVKAFWQQIFN